LPATHGTTAPARCSLVDATDASTIGIRDRALILLGFAGAFRRSELVELDVDDCVFGKDGLTVTLRRSKVDQEGVGRKIGIPDVSGPHYAGMDRTGSHHSRAGVPLHQSTWARKGRPAVRCRRGSGGQE